MIEERWSYFCSKFKRRRLCLGPGPPYLSNGFVNLRISCAIVKFSFPNFPIPLKDKIPLSFTSLVTFDNQLVVASSLVFMWNSKMKIFRRSEPVKILSFEDFYVLTRPSPIIEFENFRFWRFTLPCQTFSQIEMDILNYWFFWWGILKYAASSQIFTFNQMC